jgi:hypothetical protein
MVWRRPDRPDGTTSGEEGRVMGVLEHAWTFLPFWAQLYFQLSLTGMVVTLLAMELDSAPDPSELVTG